MSAFAAVCALDIGAIENETPAALAETPVLLRSVADLTYLVEMYPFIEGAVTVGANLGGVAVGPICALPDGDESVESTTAWYFSDKGYISGAAESPANTYWESRARVPLVVDRQMPVAPEAGRRLSVQFGTLDLLGGDGFFDTLTQTAAIDGRRIRVTVKETGAALSAAIPVFDGAGVSWALTADALRVALRDNGYLLEVPLHQNTYGGTGGADGNADIAGQVKPLLYGKCLNVTPRSIDPTNRVYQVHDGRILAVDAVYDQGASLPRFGDFADYATLTAASIPSGQYGTCLALGLLRLGATPAGLVTCDVRGGFNAATVYLDRSGAIALHFIKTFGNMPSDKLEEGGFTTLDGLAPYEVGWYWDKPLTIAAAVSEVMAGVSAAWGPARDGRVTAWRLDEPDTGGLRLGTVEIINLERLAPPPGIFPPSWRRRVAYQWNWTVQRGEDLAGAVTLARRQFLADQFRVAAFAQSSVRSKFLLATDPPTLAARFLEQTAAASEAERLQNLFGVERQLYVARVKFIGHLVEINATVRIEWPRYGLDNGKQMRVAGIREDCQRREISLLLWG